MRHKIILLQIFELDMFLVCLHLFLDEELSMSLAYFIIKLEVQHLKEVATFFHKKILNVIIW